MGCAAPTPRCANGSGLWPIGLPGNPLSCSLGRLRRAAATAQARLIIADADVAAIGGLCGLHKSVTCAQRCSGNIVFVESMEARFGTGTGAGAPDQEKHPMRFLRAASTGLRAAFELSRITRWILITATVLATTTAVLLASFVAVATGLI